MSSNNKNKLNDIWITPNTTSPTKRKRKKRKHKNKPKNNNSIKPTISTKPKHAAPPSAATIYCKWYQEGKCQRGKNCFFIHDLDPLSDKNYIEHKAMIKSLLSNDKNSNKLSTNNVQIAIKKPNKPLNNKHNDFLLPSQNKLYQTNINNYSNVYTQQQTQLGNSNCNQNNFNPNNPYRNNPYMNSALNVNAVTFQPQYINNNNISPQQQQQQPQVRMNPNYNPYPANMNNSPNLNLNNNTNPYLMNNYNGYNVNMNMGNMGNMYNGHYNPYLTPDNAHTVNPFDVGTTTNDNNNSNINDINDILPSKINDAVLNEINDYNSDDYELWEDENGELIVIEKDMLYADDPYYKDQKLLNQYNKKQNNNNPIQKGLKSGGSTYNYGSNINTNINDDNKHVKSIKKDNKYAKMAAKYNDIYHPIGKVETFKNGTNNPDYDPNAKICRFWLNGTCAFANNCKMAHRFEKNECPHCKKTFGSSPLIQQQHLAACSAKLSYDEERKLSETKECGICRENIVQKGNKFGLLTGCNHSFCLKCIREWRGVITQKKDVVRSCPICRQITYFIVPSLIFVTNKKRKNEIINTYKEKLSKIECKHFKDNEECPFSTSCFYKHKRKDGTVDDKKLKLRHIINEDGGTEIMKQLRLSEFLFGNEPSND